MTKADPLATYRTREWFESLQWQHRWIEFMVGWWAGELGKPKRVIDFGAGDGWWCHAFKQIGADACYAIELDDLAREYIPPDVYFWQHDLREPLDATGITDLSISLEVAEHMTRRQAENALIPTIVKHSGDLIMFSAAQPGQEGTGHINLRPSAYWIERFEQWPYVKLSSERTGKARAALERILPEPFQFLPRNLLVFAKI